MSKDLNLQMRVLFWIILANFIAQIPYNLHLYGVKPMTTVSMGSLSMGFVFALFILGYVLLMKNIRMGYFMLIAFLLVEFLFYLWNLVGALMHGYGLFFQLFNPDLILKIVFAIGYLNLFASGYFLVLLLYNGNSLLKTLNNSYWLA